VGSPLGIPAGPLLNSRWILYYARLGFNVLTYKTVRSAHRACYQPPNLLPVGPGQLKGRADTVTAADRAQAAESWAISFGMPSKSPQVWQKDVEAARRGLASDQVLVVSVVATPQEDWTLERIAADFVQCARWARDAGAQAVEANLSCPNVCTQEGQLYTSPEAAALISAELRMALGGLPLILKVGLFDDAEQAHACVDAASNWVDALSTVNSISAVVTDQAGTPLFDGISRGIGGASIRDRCQSELAALEDVIKTCGGGLRLIGVGGIFSATDVRARLAAGAHHVQLATAAMLDPLVAVRIRTELALENAN
jgi:dihydroorotate dehydrogenase